MKHATGEPAEEERLQAIRDKLLMPSDGVGALVLAAILLVICLSGASSFAEALGDTSVSSNTAHYRVWLHSSLAKRRMHQARPVGPSIAASSTK